MRTTIIDVKFDEESKSELTIGLPCKGKPENAENYRKIIKLLVERNDGVLLTKTMSVLVITVIYFSVFLISRLFLYQ